jgi:hypothetical protein
MDTATSDERSLARLDRAGLGGLDQSLEKFDAFPVQSDTGDHADALI